MSEEKEPFKRFIKVSEDGKSIIACGLAKDFRKPEIIIVEETTNSNQLFFKNLNLDYAGEL